MKLSKCQLSENTEYAKHPPHEELKTSSIELLDSQWYYVKWSLGCAGINQPKMMNMLADIIGLIDAQMDGDS